MLRLAKEQMEHGMQTTGDQCTHPRGQSHIGCHIEMTIEKREVCNTEGK